MSVPNTNGNECTIFVQYFHSKSDYIVGNYAWRDKHYDERKNSRTSVDEQDFVGTNLGKSWMENVACELLSAIAKRL